MEGMCSIRLGAASMECGAMKISVNQRHHNRNV